MDGRPLREHLEAAYRQTKRLPKMLADAPRLPAGCNVLWRDFQSLHAMRGSSGFGPSRISYPEIDAFQRVNRVTLAPWEIEALKRADLAFLAVQSETRKGAK